MDDYATLAAMKLGIEFDPEYIVRHPYRQISAGEYTMDASYRIVRENGLKDHLIILTLSGGGIACGEHLGPKTIYAFHPGERHDYGTDPAIGEWSFLWAHIHATNDLSTLLDWHRLELGSIPCEEFSCLREHFREAALNSATGNSLDEAIAMNAMECVLLRVARLRGEIGNVEFADKLRAYITQHITSDLSLPTLAKLVHLSTSRFAHRFREVFGLPPLAYVESCRLGAAKRLLLTTSMSIKEVALSSGFSDPLYFTRRFTKALGRPPSQWRNC